MTPTDSIVSTLQTNSAPAVKAEALLLTETSGKRMQPQVLNGSCFCIPSAATQEVCLMNSPQSSLANRERLLAVMRVCHRLGQPLPPRTRLAPLVGCTTRQIHRYVERLKAEGVVTLRRGSRCVHVQELRS